MNDKIKIVYVDDEKMNLLLFELNFKKQYTVITAESGEEALELLDMHQDTALVVSDMKMFPLNGIEFIEIAKKKYPNMKFFILTGYDITSEIQEALDSNLILEYFRKPCNFNEIKKALQIAMDIK